MRPANQEDTKVRYMPVQQNIADPNVVMTFYGQAAKQILTTGAPGSDVAPATPEASEGQAAEAGEGAERQAGPYCR